MDEADALLADTNDSSGTNNEMRSIFLQRMDSESLPPNLKYILTTNYPEKITPAAIRTGRLRAVKINNPKYEQLTKIYRDALTKNFSDKLENKQDLEEIVNLIPTRYPVLGPAHIKAVTEKLNSALLHSNNSKITKKDLETAFVEAHRNAFGEYFDRCNAIVPSKNTSYDVDKNNIDYAKNLARVCLLAAHKTPEDNDIDLLANNIPIELMPKAVKMIKDDIGVTEEAINEMILELNRNNFNVSLQMDDLQEKIDNKVATKIEG